MATLEKIRSKSVLLIVIIGVALLAFIIGDFFTSGRTLFGTGTTVAKVDGHSLDVMDFQKRMEQHNQQNQQTNRRQDGAQLQQQVINEMVSETLFQEELAKLGLTVTDAELQDLMLGRGAAILNNRVAQESQGQIQSISELHNRITRPAEYGMTPDQVQPLVMYWKQLENEMEQQLLQQKFVNLFTGALTANQLDAKALYDENANLAHVAFTRKNFAALPDTAYTVTDQEIQAEWAKNKNSYRLAEPTRTISYITVGLVPSADDVLAGQQRVETALGLLRSGDDASVLSDMADFVVETAHNKPAAIRDNRVRAYLDTATVGSADVVNRNANSYTLVKVLGKSAQTDSVNIDFLVVTDGAKLDSIRTALNNGAKVADFTDNDAVASPQTDMWVSLLDPSMQQLRDVLTTSATGTYFTPDTASTQGARLFRINSRKAPVTVYDYATVSYTVDPSEATIDRLENDLATFVETNRTAAAFAENALEAGYQVLPAKVTASSPSVGNLTDTRNAVVWALGADKGDVSPVFGNQQTGHLVAVALNDIYDEYTPANDPQVRDFLALQVRNQKKGDALIEQFGGKATDLQGYANLFGGTVDSTTVSFGQIVVPSIGMGESEFQAQAALAAPGKVVGPIKGNQSVIVFEIVSVDEPARPFDFDESARQFSGNRGSYVMMNMIPQILLGNKKVDNRLSNFYRE